MTTFREALSDGVTNGICEILETGRNYFDWVQDIGVPGQGIARIPTDLAYRYLCNREPPALPAPPFIGGQCPVLYSVQVKWDYHINDNPAERSLTDNFQALGPIRGVIHRIEGPNVICKVLGAITASNPSGEYQCFESLGLAAFPGYALRSIRILSVARIDGQPDICGNPAPVPEPPDENYRQRDINITYQDNSQTNIDLTGNFTFGSPTINLRGELTIPVRIDIGDINIPIKGELNINNPEITLDFRNINYGPSSQPNPDNYRSPDDTPPNPPDVPDDVIPPSPDDPEDESRRVIRGVIVTTTEIPEDFGVIFQDLNPDIYIPNLGYINFQIAVGPVTAWTVDLPVKNLRCFIPCEWEGGAISVRGTPRSGVVWILSEVYATEDEVNYAT